MKPAFLIFLTLMAFASPSSATDLKACGHHDYAPWNWKKGGDIVGVCAEITKTLFGKLGLTVDLAYRGPWERCQKNVESGMIDINICSFINGKRQQYSEFVMAPIGVNENAVFVNNKRSFRFADWPDLNGKAAGIVAGVSIGQKFDDFLSEHLKVQTVKGFYQAFKMLEAGRVDFVPTGRHSGRAMVRAYQLEHQITDLPAPILFGNLHLSMSKKSKYLSTLPEIERMLQHENYNVWVAELLEKYTKMYADDFIEQSSN